MESFTTHSTGIRYGLVKDHGNCDLETAKSRIANPKMRDHAYSVHVFRNVIEPRHEIPRWTPEEAASFYEDAINVSLQSVEEGNLYEKFKISLKEQHVSGGKRAKGRREAIGSHILQCLNGNDGSTEVDGLYVCIGLERRSIVSWIEQFFKHATQATKQFLYVYNSDEPPPGFVSYLNGISGHLDPGNNSRIGEMPGINISEFYVGSPGSFTETHNEDSISDSANLLHAGKEKIWMIIDRADYIRTNRIVAQIIKNHRRDDEQAEDEEETKNCVLPLHHKNLVLTPRLLDEHKIRYEFVVQKAGDLVYVRYGVLHQVVNGGINVAEAINVGSDGWNFANELQMLCSCKNCCLIHAPTNTDVNMCVKVGKPNPRTHGCDVCDRTFGTKALLLSHQKEDHSAKHACRLCDKQFAHMPSLRRHVKIAHATGEERGNIATVCPTCKKSIGDIARHQRERHVALIECSGCRMNFTRHDLGTHEKTCLKSTCADCNNDFKSRRALRAHQRWCQKDHVSEVVKKRRVDVNVNDFT